MQFPPNFAFDLDVDVDVADALFRKVRARYDGLVAAEPRHSSWFEDEAQLLLRAWQVARVAADSACVPAAAVPVGWPGIVYFRLPGSPRMHYLAYDDAFLESTAAQLIAAPASAWCIFDNTTLGAATGNAPAMVERVR